MLGSSLRRAARACPSSHSIPPRPSTPSTIRAPFTSKCHQRNHSSSKPPVPPKNGSSNITTPPVKTAEALKSKDLGEKRGSVESRPTRRKAGREKSPRKEELENEWTKDLPSVPSTQYLNPKDVYVASFFSTHRPMSITSPLPPETDPEAFEKIFAPRPKSSKQKLGLADVIYTLSSAVQNLDEHVADQRQNPQHEQSINERADLITQLTQHNHQVSNPADANQPHNLDGQSQGAQVRIPNGVKLVIQEIARRFRPYNIPPVPTPVSAAEIEAQEAEAAAAAANEELQANELEEQIQSQSQDHVRNAPSTTAGEHEALQNGRFFTSRAALLERAQFSNSMEQHIIEGMRRRPIYYPVIIIRHRPMTRRTPTLHAISVKRQRRLKMKKHKYKKLMRKTRNLRRRQDKL